MGTTSTSPPLEMQERGLRGRLWFRLGIALAVLGPLVYFLQIRARLLTIPWYLPPLAVLAVVLCLLALVQRPRSPWRWLGLVFSSLLATVACFLVFGLSTPPYTGPLAEGRPFPEFVAARAGGEPFTRQDFLGDRSTVLVFFRGHW
jgi:hypothetical protein